MILSKGYLSQLSFQIAQLVEHWLFKTKVLGSVLGWIFSHSVGKVLPCIASIYWSTVNIYFRTKALFIKCIHII